MTEEMQLSDEEILSSISEHAGSEPIRLAHWLRNVKYNEKNYGFSPQSPLGGPPTDFKRFEGHKALIVGAGPAFKRFGEKDLIKVVTSSPTFVIACDGALPTLAKLGITPHVVVSVDAHPVVANFYRRAMESRMIGPPPITLLSTTIHRDVVEACRKMGAPIGWFQTIAFKEIPMPEFYREGVFCIDSGGNVGTTCYIFASMVFKCSPIGLMGLEFSWSDETPLQSTQYFDQIMKITGQDAEKAKKLFKVVHNKRDSKDYVADPVYYAYWLRFKEMWKLLPPQVRKHTFNLTKQGILSAPGLRQMTAKEFAEL